MVKKGTKANDKDSMSNDKSSTSDQLGSVSNDEGSVSAPLPGGKRVHVGVTIRKLLYRERISTTELAGMLGISPKSTRVMLRKKYLHTARLVQISHVLQHDVLRYLYMPENLPGNAPLMKQVQELEQENEALKKENEMLKEMNTLLKERK